MARRLSNRAQANNSGSSPTLALESTTKSFLGGLVVCLAGGSLFAGGALPQLGRCTRCGVRMNWNGLNGTMRSRKAPLTVVGIPHSHSLAKWQRLVQCTALASLKAGVGSGKFFVTPKPGLSVFRGTYKRVWRDAFSLQPTRTPRYDAEGEVGPTFFYSGHRQGFYSCCTGK